MNLEITFDVKRGIKQLKDIKAEDGALIMVLTVVFTVIWLLFIMALVLAINVLAAAVIAVIVKLILTLIGIEMSKNAFIALTITIFVLSLLIRK